MPINAGELNQRIVLERRQEETDSSGQVRIAGPGMPWTDVAGMRGTPGPVVVPCQDRSCQGHKTPISTRK